MYKGQTHVTSESLLKYIVSFRDECHFHEEICETVYKRLYDALSPEELVVTCLYARRGGIDINPVRASNVALIARECQDLVDPFVMHTKTSKQ
jgi:7-cyano-7-deazaguanine reductase